MYIHPVQILLKKSKIDTLKRYYSLSPHHPFVTVMTERKRRFVLHNNDTDTRLLAKRLIDKGYTVMFHSSESEELKPFPV